MKASALFSCALVSCALVGLLAGASAHAEEPAPAKADDKAGSANAGPPQVALPSGVGDVRPGGKSLGLGVAIGSPVGLAGKYYLTGASALSFILGFWGTEYGGGVVDYLFHPLGALGDGGYGTPFLAVGGGVAVGIGNNVGGGRGAFNGRALHSFTALNSVPYSFASPGNLAVDVHGTLGLGWSFKAPVDLFVEFSPGLLIVPQLNVGTRLALGGRFYF